MKITPAKSVIYVIGYIWLPSDVICAQTHELDAYDIHSLTKGETIEVSREAVRIWLALHAGDFSSIQDFSASLEINGETIEIPWEDEESVNNFASVICVKHSLP